jgi:hypothetical protein
VRIWHAVFLLSLGAWTRFQVRITRTGRVRAVAGPASDWFVIDLSHRPETHAAPCELIIETNLPPGARGAGCGRRAHLGILSPDARQK